MFDLPPTIQVADRTIEESHERGYGSLSVADILEYSSNVGAVTIGLELGAEDFDHWIHAFGFGEPTGVQFPGEEQGIVIPVDDYSGSTMGNLPIGQGLSVTPMQMAAAYSAIADGGVLRTPQLVLSEDGEPVPEDPGKRVISRKDAARAPRDARGRARPGRHRLGGQRPRLHARRQDRHGAEGRSRDRHLLGDRVRRLVRRLRPGAGPALLVAVVVDNPKGDYYGGTVAAPAFGEIAKFALPYLQHPAAVAAGVGSGGFLESPRWSFASCSPAPT